LHFEYSKPPSPALALELGTKLLLENELLRLSSKPKEVQFWHSDLLVLCRHFRDLTLEAFGDNVQSLRKSISTAQEERVHFYQV
jgi:hypothetical protein